MADARAGRGGSRGGLVDDALTLARLFCDRVPHSRDLGMVIVPTDGRLVRMRLTPQPYLLDEAVKPTVCSSALYSLADSAAGLAVFAATRTLSPIATLDLRMNYLRPAPGDRALEASADCEGVTDDVAFVRCRVHADGHPDPVATGDATFMRGTRGRQFDAEPPPFPADLPGAVFQASRASTPARSTRRTMLAHGACWQSEDRSPVATGRVQLLLDGSSASADPLPAGSSRDDDTP